MSVKHEPGSTLPELVAVMKRLLAPDGCPWDREQTFATLRRYVLEEACEVIDAGEALGDEAAHPAGPARALGATAPEVQHLCEELGDLLLQVVFQSELAHSRGWFDCDDVVHGISSKMRRRHPHVFGDVRVADSAAVLTNWEAQKARERGGRGRLEGVPRSLPALARAQRLGEKVALSGLAVAPTEPRAGLDALDAALEGGDRARAESALGEALFSLVDLARAKGLDPERALAARCSEFGARFASVEQRVAESGRPWNEQGPDALAAHWAEAAPRKE